MIRILYPPDVNWFYKSQAEKFCRAMARNGAAVATTSPLELVQLIPRSGDVLLLQNFAECVFAARRSGLVERLIQRVSEYEGRILLNYDSLYSTWFKSQLAFEEGLINAVIDIGMYRQDPELAGQLVYEWVSESFDQHEDKVMERGPCRPIPWAFVGHSTAARVSFVSAVAQVLGSNGFVYMPALRPYGAKSGLDEKALNGVLASTDIYIWSSHHNFAYHEGLRALHAVSAGCVPVKIDPLNHREFSTIPWVYASLKSFASKRDSIGLDAMYQEARAFITSRGSIGANLIKAIHSIQGNKAVSAKDRERLKA